MKAERLGLFAEIRAIGYLRRCGLTLVDARFRARGGEIDLIARERDTIVFVEVKAGVRSRGAAMRVDGEKRARLLRAAAEYLRRHPAQSVRFDVLEADETGFRLIRNAF